MSTLSVSSKIWSPSDILTERRAREKAGMFAHTVETYGPECIWWVHCGCFGCRDHFDPEGIRDAWARNKNPEVSSFLQLTEEEREGAPDVTERNVDHLLDLIFGPPAPTPAPTAMSILRGPPPLEPLPADFPTRTKSHYPGMCGDHCEYGCHTGLSNDPPSGLSEEEFLVKLQVVRNGIVDLKRESVGKDSWRADILTNVLSLLNSL